MKIHLFNTACTAGTVLDVYDCAQNSLLYCTVLEKTADFGYSNGIAHVNVICFTAVFLHSDIQCITKPSQARRSCEMTCVSRLLTLTKRLV